MAPSFKRKKDKLGELKRKDREEMARKIKERRVGWRRLRKLMPGLRGMCGRPVKARNVQRQKKKVILVAREARNRTSVQA